MARRGRRRLPVLWQEQSLLTEDGGIMKKLPKEIFVRLRDEDEGNEWFEAYTDVNDYDVDYGTSIAVYVLKQKGTIEERQATFVPEKKKAKKKA